MEIKFTLDETDYLAYQLNVSSKSGRIKKKMINYRAGLTLGYLVVSASMFNLNEMAMGYVSLFCGIYIALKYPSIVMKRRKKEYLTQIRELLKNNFGKENDISITDEHIEITDFGGESKIKLEQIVEIIETDDHYFIPFLSGQALIIPKKKTDNLLELKGGMDSLISKLHLNHHLELDQK